MTTSTKVKSFVKQVVAVIQGDSAEALGQKILRQADGELTVQIAIFKSKVIKLETNVEKAKEREALALINNGKLIDEDSDYVSNLLLAENNVISAEEELETMNRKIEFLQKKLALLSEEVDA